MVLSIYMARDYTKSQLGYLLIPISTRLDTSLWRTLVKLGIPRTKLTRLGNRGGQRKRENPSFKISVTNNSPITDSGIFSSLRILGFQDCDHLGSSKLDIQGLASLHLASRHLWIHLFNLVFLVTFHCYPILYGIQKLYLPKERE